MTNKTRRRRRWPTVLLVARLLVGGSAAGAWYFGLLPGSSNATSSATSTLPTVAIQSLDVAQAAVSASGNLELVDERSVPLGVGGIVRTVAVATGDAVQAGQVLVQLDTTDLERAYAEAQLNVESAKLTLSDLQTPATPAELAEAQANLETAQQNLIDVQAGASAEEIAAAQSTLAAAQLSYGEKQAGPTDDEMTQLSATLRKNEIALADAQRAYDQVAWRGGESSESVALQSATIDYESALATYNEATAPTAASEVQSSLSSIQSAQAQLNTLLASPTQAEIAAAQAQVATAQAALDDLQTGATDSALRAKQISLEQSLIALEQASRDLEAATLTAPVDGVVMSVDAQVGVRSNADSIVVTLADPTQLQLVIDVAEADIVRVQVGQSATVELDALPGNEYAGVVAAIAPTNNSSASAISYPVTVRLTDASLASVLPGMNAVATLTSEEIVAAGSWLVPSNALNTQGGSSTVTVVRNNAPIPVQVTAAGVQGEWTIVQSSELQAGDEVVGSLVSNLDSNVFGGRPSGMTGGAIPMGAGGPPPGGN